MTDETATAAQQQDEAPVPRAPSWLELREASSRAALAVVEDAFERAADVTHRRYLERIALPFAVASCVRELHAVVALNCLSHDPGEAGLPAAWLPDEEWTPPPIDSWARNTVPERRASSAPSETAAAAVASASGSDVGHGAQKSQQPQRKLRINRPQQQTKPAAAEEAEPSKPAEPVASLQPPPQRPLHRRLRVVKATKKEQASLEAEEQAEAQAPKMPKEFTFSHTGNVIALAPIPPEKLPPSVAQVRAVVVEDAAIPAAAPSAVSKGGAGKVGSQQQQQQQQTQQQQRHNTHRGGGKTKRRPETTETAHVPHFVPDTGPPPPPLIDAMRLAPGVTVREGSRVRYGGPQPAAATATTRGSRSAPSSEAVRFPPIGSAHTTAPSQQPTGRTQRGGTMSHGGPIT